MSEKYHLQQDALLAALTDQAHVWVARTDAIQTGRLRELYGAMLNAEELARYERFYFDRDRDHYLAAHALLRLSLSRYMRVDPADWTFGIGLNGQPFLQHGPAMPPLFFSLSHTQGLVACVVSLDSACGVDVEIINPSRDIYALAREVFSETEIVGLGRCSACDAVDRFFTIWTLKEAYIKATGQGFSASLKQIAFEVDGPAPLLRLDGTDMPTPQAWVFLSNAPTPQHKLAVAVHGRIVQCDIVCTNVTL